MAVEESLDKIIDYRNLHDMVRATVERCPDKVAYRWILNDNGTTDAVTWAEHFEKVKRASKSLMKLGVGKEDKVGIISYTCYPWVLSDMAACFIGAVTVGIYHTSITDDIKYILKHSESKIVFVEKREHLHKLLEMKDSIPNVRKVVLFNGERREDDGDWVLTFDDFLKLGDDLEDELFYKKVEAVAPDDLAAIVYTSGTTGIPKGAMLTHDNMIFSSQSVAACAEVEDTDETFLFLPLAHIFARLTVYLNLLYATSTTFCRSMETIVDDLKIARPHWFASVPRVFEKVHTRVLSTAEAKGGVVLKLFNWALKSGEKVSDHIVAKEPVPPLLKMQYNLAMKLVFAKLHKALGGRVRFCVSGAAPLSPEISKFFHSAGILICEGYGMTENMSFTNVNRLDRFKFGSVGLPGVGITLKIAEDGEIVCRGRNVMRGYYKMEEETAQAIDANGWLHSGDLGVIDEDGFLTITGRKKELIITSSGKNISPSRIEGLLSTSKYINQAFVLGDRRNYLTALITLDTDNLMDFASNRGITFKDPGELNHHQEVIDLIQGEVDKVNRELARFETIKKFTLVPEFTVENELITPTLKLKKNRIQERFKESIDAMYKGA